MLIVRYPEIARETLRFPMGFHSFKIPEEPVPFLIVKLLHQYLLTAKMNKGLKVYVIPLKISGIETIGLMSAFFEDSDSPLTLWTPLANEPASARLIRALLEGDLEVHLFDEHNRELLGYKAKVKIPPKVRALIERAKFHDLSHQLANDMLESAADWFATRTDADDAEAIEIEFGESLFPENMLVLDLHSQRYGFHGSKGFSHISLVKEEPGQFQELDIIFLLQRVFPANQIYYAPKRIYDGEEIADVIVLTDSVCLIIQAKDSPNTEKMLQNSLERKRLKSLKQLKEACNQAAGAIGYLERVQPLKMRIDDDEIEIDLATRDVLSLVVVRELFMDSYAEYSQILMELFERIELPCIALDYPELHAYTTYCEDEDAFFRAYFQVFNAALELGEFPRLRFGIKDLHHNDGGF